MALLQAVTSSSIVKTKTLVLSIGVDWITSNFELQFCFLLYEYYFVSHTHFGWEIKLSEISHYWITIWMCAKEHIKHLFYLPHNNFKEMKRAVGFLAVCACATVNTKFTFKTPACIFAHSYINIMPCL